MLLRRLLVTYISASVFWGLTGIACFGQTTGTIVGQVNDPISAAVTAVQAENTDTGRIPKAMTHTEDTYLIPGAYKIFVSPASFQAARTVDVWCSSDYDTVLNSCPAGGLPRCG